MSISLFRKAYSEYWDTIENRFRAPCEMMPYEFKLTHSLGPIYSQMEREYTQELLNSINLFAKEINSLTKWTEVLSKYNEKEQRVLRFEFTRLPMYYCLNQPNSTRDRSIYSATHLCHQANLLRDSDYQDKLKPDHHIDREELKRVSKDWQTANRLLNAIDSVAGKLEFNL